VRVFWDQGQINEIKAALRRIEASQSHAEKVLDRILELLKPHEAASLNLTVGTAVGECSQTAGIGETAMNLVSQQVVGTKTPLSIAPADADGNPATVDQADEPVQWTSTDPAVVEITDVAADGLSCMAHYRSAGTASVSVKADADLDPAELRELVDTIDFTVVAAGKPEAATLGITIGAAVPE
jgi:hypothetical protein